MVCMVRRDVVRCGFGIPAAKVVVVGGGAGGVELALAMQYRLKQLFRESGRDPEAVVVEIVNRGNVVLSSHNRSGPCLVGLILFVLCFSVDRGKYAWF